MIVKSVALVLLASALPAFAQQRPAQIELPDGFQPRYPEGAGFRVLVDEAHNNFHTAGGRYAPFAWLASRDGHLIGRNTGPLTAAMLNRAQILVIANARPAARNHSGQALTPAEIDAILAWIEGGGAMLLVLDHAPFPSHVAALTDRLGIRVLGDASRGSAGTPDTFEARRGNIPANEVNCDGSIRWVRSFRGSALQGPAGSIPLLMLDESWTVGGEPPAPDAAQALAFRRGRGRVVVAGEAAMFTAQAAGSNERLRGIGAQGSRDNIPFVLALLQWLGAGQVCAA